MGDGGFRSGTARKMLQLVQQSGKFKLNSLLRTSIVLKQSLHTKSYFSCCSQAEKLIRNNQLLMQLVYV